MNKFRLMSTMVILAIFFSFANVSPAVATANSWTPAGSMTIDRQFHTATLLANGKVLVAGGFKYETGPNVASAELYDPTTNTWTTAASMTIDRSQHTATLLANGKVLVAGG